jgi:AcrR family transcriptional regulator
MNKARLKRPRKRVREFSREEILDTARNLFVQNGYESVTIRKIASEIGCASGTIYLHFADKAEIFESLCTETFHKLTTRLVAIAEDNDDPVECLKRGCRCYIAFALEHPSHYIVTFVTPKSGHQPAILQAGIECFGNLRRMVVRCIDEGYLRLTNVDEVSQVIWTSLHGLVSLQITHSEFPFLEQTRLAERHIDVLVTGIRRT